MKLKSSLALASLMSLLPFTAARAADDPPAVFSGPQKGETLVPFHAVGVYDDLAGKDLDFVSDAGDAPLILVFVHKLTRPSLGLTRLITEYTHSRRDEIRGGIAWLAEDRADAEAYLLRARRSLNLSTPVGISVDGPEGPGAYGLHRDVSLTILIAKARTVTANFALIQPSDIDAPAIFAAITDLIGGEAPKIEDLRRRGQRDGGGDDSVWRRLLGPVIQKDASPEDVARAAAQVEEYVEDMPERQRILGQKTRAVVSGKIFAEGGYGTEAARAKLREWAETYGGLPRERETRLY